MRKAICKPKEVEGNGVVAFVEHVIFRAIALKVDREPTFKVERKDGEPLVYHHSDIQKLKEDYLADIVSHMPFSPKLY